ncbi:hypothetical protein [Fusobacterium perfoetens]|uniref:hypothetical protein n=1 Tax=Fusobacterium perfoetens TaxID=852 RepID=UPI001F400584|nr:hypothetical protein [Fusobacterium perfoetens]MCF2612841.1 hypothetical protein [Fusobacterium perfoetens]
MKYKVCFNLFITFISCLISLYIVFLYDGYEGYEFIFILPLSFGVFTLLSIEMFCKCIPDNFGVTILYFLLFFRNVIFPLFYTLGRYKNEFGVSLSDIMNKAIWLSVYEMFFIFIALNICSSKQKKIIKKLKYIEEKQAYNIQKMRILVLMLLLIFVGTFIIVPQCSKFYMNILEITNVKFSNNEMSAVIDIYATSFISKFVLVLHNYLTKIIRFILPLHLIMEIHKKNKRNSGYIFCLVLSSVSIIIIDGTIARGIVYAIILMLLTCIIYKKEDRFFVISIIFIVVVITYFFIRAVILSRLEVGIWSYLSSYVGSYFSSIANTAANIRMELSLESRVTYFLYDFLESIPFGNTLFGLEKISYQKEFNIINNSYGQIPTTIGTAYTYFGFFLSPIYSFFFTKITYKAGLVAQKSKVTLKKGVYLLLSVYCSMAITMYYIKIVLVVILGTILPMIIMIKIIEKSKMRREQCSNGIK